MSKNIFLILGVTMIILGAILKITHKIEPWNDWIFRTGFVVGLIYLVLKNRKTVTPK